MADSDQASTHAAKRKPTTIWDLPLFIREQIYDHVLGEMVIFVHVAPDGKRIAHEINPDAVPRPNYAVAQICRGLREEALPRLYRKAVFYFAASEVDIARLMRMVKVRASHDKNEEPEVQACLKRAGEDGDTTHDAVFEAHLQSLSEVVREMRHVKISYRHLPAVGWDSRSWSWDDSIYDIFPNLQELCVHFVIATAGNLAKPLSTEFDPLTGELIDFSEQTNTRYTGDAHISDGEFVQNLALSSNRRFPIKFTIDVVEHYITIGTTKFALDPEPKPGAEPHVDMLEWDEFYSVNGAATKFLREYGLHDAAREIQEIFDQRLSTRFVLDGTLHFMQLLSLMQSSS